MEAGREVLQLAPRCLMVPRSSLRSCEPPLAHQHCPRGGQHSGAGGPWKSCDCCAMSPPRAGTCPALPRSHTRSVIPGMGTEESRAPPGTPQSCLVPVDDAGAVPAGPAVGNVLPCPVRVSPATEQKCCEPGDPTSCASPRLSAAPQHGHRPAGAPLLPGSPLLSCPVRCPSMPGQARCLSAQRISQLVANQAGMAEALNPLHSVSLVLSPPQSCTSCPGTPQDTLHLPTHSTCRARGHGQRGGQGGALTAHSSALTDGQREMCQPNRQPTLDLGFLSF